MNGIVEILYNMIYKMNITNVTIVQGNQTLVYLQRFQQVLTKRI